jgi:tetratricopeptide (TPR) repeat protein
MTADPLVRIEQLANAGKYSEAEELIRTSKLKPALALALYGVLAMKQGDLQRAEVQMLKSLELDPSNPLANGNYSHLLLQQKKAKRALPYAEKAYASAPKHLNFALSYAAALADADRHREATEIVKPFAEQDRPKVSVLITYASLLRADLKAEEALAILRRAQELYPDDIEAQKNIADAYAEVDPIEAKRAFDKVFEAKADTIPLRWNASFVELRLRNFRRGWELYEEGLTEKVGKIGRPLPSQVKPIKLVTKFDELDPNLWTLFCAEQGLGDQVLFFSALEEAIKIYSKSVIIGEDRMVPVIQRSFPDVGVYTYGFAAGLWKQQHRMNGIFPIGSIMKHLRPDIQSFERGRRPFLVPNEQSREKFHRTLRDKLPGRELIGISWRGGYWERQKRTKSFDFELFARLMKSTGKQFISLQYGDVSEERKMAKEKGWPITFIEGIDFKKDIDNWMSLACACDRIISVSTALVHFAGAAGKRVDLLIGDHQAPFIWGLEEGPALPYPEVRITRKLKRETPEQYFDRIADTLV